MGGQGPAVAASPSEGEGEDPAEESDGRLQEYRSRQREPWAAFVASVLSSTGERRLTSDEMGGVDYDAQVKEAESGMIDADDLWRCTPQYA